MRLQTSLGDTPRSVSIWATLERAITARRGAYALGFIILASLAFRVHVSRECSLWLDEVDTRVRADYPWPAVLKGPSRENPPLMFVLVKLAMGLFGTSETGVRSVSLVFGVVLLAATYELCLELGLTIGRALLVVTTLALCPFFIRHCTEARQYAMLSTFVTLAMTRALRRVPSGRDLVVFAVSALAAAFTHYFGLAYVLALLGVLILGLGPMWKQARPIGRALSSGLLLGLLGLLGVVAVRAAALGRFYDTAQVATKPGVALNTELLGEIASEFSFLNADAVPLAVEPVLAIVGLSLLTWRLRGRARLLPLGIGIAPCLAALFISTEHFLAARYLLPSAILYHLGACIALFALIDGVGQLLARGARTKAFAPVMTGLVLISVIAVRLREFPNGFGVGMDDYRGLQRYFVSNLAKDTRLVTYIGSFGQLIFGKEYRIGSAPIWLERFRPVRGIDRYLVVEIHIIGPERRADLEALVARKFGLSPEAWRSLPVVSLPHSIYQPAVVARFVQLQKDHSYGPVTDARQHEL